MIVGCNEPMSDLLTKYGFGVALKGDGSNVVEISDAIQAVMHDYDVYVENIKKQRTYRMVKT